MKAKTFGRSPLHKKWLKKVVAVRTQKIQRFQAFKAKTYNLLLDIESQGRHNGHLGAW